MARPIFLESKNLFLSPLSKDDKLENYSRWINDQETTLFMGSGKFPLSIDALKDYINGFKNSRDGMLLGIFLKENLNHIGNVTLQDIEHTDRRAEIGIFIGEKEARGKGYATEVIKILAGHAFKKLNLNKLTSGIIEGNDSSKKVFMKAGFSVEGILREHFYLDGKYLDCIRMGLFKSEYESER